MNATQMSAAELWTQTYLLNYLLNSLWQIPAIFGLAWIAARLARPGGPQAEHRIWVGALLLEAILPGCQFDLSQLGYRVWRHALTWVGWQWAAGTSGSRVRIVAVHSLVSQSDLLHLSSTFVKVILLVYLASLLYSAGRLYWGLWQTHRLLRNSKALSVSDTTLFKTRHGSDAIFPIGKIRVSPRLTGPVTIGIFPQLLLVPASFLQDVSLEDLNAVLAHETAHMRRCDFLKNLLYSLLSLPAAYHPLLWLTNSRLAGTREMVCDEMAAAALTAHAGQDDPQQRLRESRDRYAHSLLRLASRMTSRTQPITVHAIGIFDANIFERRIMTMIQTPDPIHRTHRLSIALGSILLAAATCTSAVAVRMEIAAPQDKTEKHAPLERSVNEMKLLHQVHPIYPPDAKEKKIEGTVILDAIIGKDGTVEHISVKSGPDALQKSALDAVQQWRYEPYLLNGDPVEVETTINIIFSLEK